MRFPKPISAFRFLFSIFLLSLPAQAQQEIEVRAKGRVFPEVTAGVSALARDAHGQYYLLPTRGTSVLVFGREGKQLAQIPTAGAIPAPGSTSASGTSSNLQFGTDLDVSCPGRADAPCLLYIADRGANAVRVFSSRGDYLGSFTVPGPTSLRALSEGEVAVATMREPRLVQVYNAQGKLAREFGATTQIAEGREFNRFLNIGRLGSDAAGHVYYAFTYVPEPTVRKYDRFGYAALEIELATLDFQPTSQAARREIARQDTRSGGRAPVLKPVINALGVEPESQDIWIAVGGLLLRFDKDGTRRGTYRIFTAEGARIEAVGIVVEAERVLVASETLGVFELPRPDKLRR